MRRGCRLQDRSTMQGQSKSLQHVVAHHRGGERGAACSGWDLRTSGVLGSWNEGTSRDLAWWHFQWWQLHGARKKEEVRGRRLTSPPCFFENLLAYFCFLSGWRKLLVNIRFTYLHAWICVYVILCISLSKTHPMFIYFYILVLNFIIGQHTSAVLLLPFEKRAAK